MSEKEWIPVILDDIFSISSGTRLESRNKQPGNRPFIGAADNNNGVTGFVSNNNASVNGAPTVYISGLCLFGGVEVK